MRMSDVCWERSVSVVLFLSYCNIWKVVHIFIYTRYYGFVAQKMVKECAYIVTF